MPARRRAHSRTARCSCRSPTSGCRSRSPTSSSGSRSTTASAITETFHPVTFTSKLRQGVYTTLDFAAADVLREFFDRMQGRRGEFYMPTFRADLPLASAAASGTSTLTVTGTEVNAFYDGSTVYDAVATYVDGAWRTNRVVGIAESGGNSVLTMSHVWGLDIPVDATVSWMPVWRFATDTFEVEWIMNRLATVQMTFRMLENETAEVVA
jgi:hypothetical protein